MMAKVLVIGSFSDSLIRFRRNMLEAMVSRGNEVFACAPAASKEIQEELKHIGVVYQDISLDRTGTDFISDFRYLVSMVRLIHKIRPDIVLPYTVKPVLYGSIAAALAGVPTTASMITGLGYAASTDTWKSHLLSRLVRTLYRVALRSNRVVFFQNPDDLEYFRSLGMVSERNRPTLINGSGVDLAHFSPRPFPESISFLLIARLIREKGIREYVEAARLLRTRYPHAKFRLVGWIDNNPGSVTREELDAWIQTGDVEYLGSLNDVRPAIANASVYVLPSYREGTPRSVLEAMAMGRPIVTTDAPGCRETVVEGKNGFLVPVRDATSLAAALERFILDPGQVPLMGSASRRIAEEKYDVHKVNGAILHALGLFPTGMRMPLKSPPLAGVTGGEI